MADSLEARSRDVQERTFCKWLNTKLESNGYEPMTSLVRDLSDGVRLVQLIEIMGDASLGRYNKNPRMRVQKAENVNLALEFIRSRGVKLTNIGPEDIIDGNVKLILGMIWTLILRFTIADISEEGLSAKEGLLLWCQRRTEPYEEVDVQDFSNSWADGLALCALIHRHRPELLDYNALDKSDIHGNTLLAFQLAEHHLRIPRILEIEDLCDAKPPDERSVMTYVANFFHAFSTMDQAETVSRRVQNFADLMRTIWTSRNDFERRAREFLSAQSDMQSRWSTDKLAETYKDAKVQSVELSTYKRTKKRDWLTERQELTMLFSNIQTKLKTYGLRDYIPPGGCTLVDLDVAWLALMEAEASRTRSINANIRQIKDRLQRQFADTANAFHQRLHKISQELAALNGPLDEQKATALSLQSQLMTLQHDLHIVSQAEEECRVANVEENDYTIFTYPDLEFEYRSIVQGTAKKISFVDNQVISRQQTNLTPAQLEQFESTFRYFDKDASNTLNMTELTSALASLGILYSDEDRAILFQQLEEDYGAVTYEAFINLMVGISEDNTSIDQLREAFQVIAQDQPVVTEVQLQVAHLSPVAVQYLRDVMPTAANGNIDAAPGFDYEAFLQNMFI